MRVLGFRDCLGDGGGRGGFDCRDLLLPLGLLGDAQLFFHLGAKFVRGSAKVGHQLAELTRKDRQLLRAEEKQGEENEDGCVRKTRHGWPYDTAWVRWKQMGCDRAA